MEVIEVWKDAIGYQGLYQASSIGRIKSLARVDNNNHEVRERILKASIGGSKYLQVELCKDCNKKTKTIHRIVATAFISNPENKPQVNHINGNKIDNAIDNLEWVTHQENLSHAANMGFMTRESRVSVSKLVEFDIFEIRRRLANQESGADIARDYSVSQTTISKIKKRVIWKHI